MNAIPDHPHKHSISAEEYLRMGEAEVFGHEARLELIEGEIIEMAPIKPPHAGRVMQLDRLLQRRIGDRALVSAQGPVLVTGRSVPQPDLAVLKPRADFYTGSLPTVGDVILVIEVSDTSLGFDLETKVPMYARAGIPEVWVVDVNGRGIHVFRHPAHGVYRSTVLAGTSERVACEGLPEAAIDVAELFPG